jgi:DNA-directed RNA polymerase specialized sigma24 family protein
VTYDPYTLPEGTEAAIKKIARDIAYEFGCSDKDDLVQDCWTWIGQFPKQSAKWWYESKVDASIKFSWLQFRRDMTRVCAERARKDKRAKLGLTPDDEYNYGRPVVEMYLPFVWHSDVLARIGEVDDGQPRARVDKATTGDAYAAAMDVRNAYHQVITPGSDWDLTLLLIYCYGSTQEEAAVTLDITQGRVSQRVREAIEAIIHALNGTAGGIEYATDGIGTRPVMSNAQSQSIVSMYTDAA